jgi:hypothetical protein
MSEVRLVLRDAERELSGIIHGSVVDRVVAALSAEPETIAELESALGRIERVAGGSTFGWFRAGSHDEPYDAGLVVIDLAARLIASESTYSSPSRSGAILCHDGDGATDQWVHYHLPDDWQISSEAWNWQPLAEARRRERLAQGPLDARAVLYGLPLLEFIATGCFQGFHSPTGSEPAALALAEVPDDANWRGFDEDGPPPSELEQLVIRDIHARWLLGARSDLRGQPPRNVLLARKGFIDWDLQDRANQWSAQNGCPPGLDVNSHAYRFGGFGTHEIVIYYYLVRWLLWSCRNQIATLAASPQAKFMSAGDFCAIEVPRLGQVRDVWLDSPDPEYHGRTPRSIIDRERRRLPEGLDPEEAVVDHDCPLCQMMADGLSGPVFWHLDGCNMDSDFAFSFHATSEEWEAEQREYEEFSRKCDAERAERERLGVKYPGTGYADPDMVWERSFVAKESDGLPLELRLFGIGSNLAELIVDLKKPTEERSFIDQLSRDFGNLREIVHSDDANRALALASPVIDRFCDTLADVAAARNGLRPMCEDLCQRLQRFFEPPSQRAALGSGGDGAADDDIPF